MVSKNSVNPGVVSPEVSSGDFWMKGNWILEKCYKIT